MKEGGKREPLVAVTRQAIGAAQQLNPWIRYINGIGHGFALIDVTPERVQADYHHTPAPTSARPDPRTVHGLAPTDSRSFQTVAGSRRTSAATGPVGPRSDRPVGA